MSDRKISCFRDRLSELISSSGKSQSSIAADFGIARQTISAWITGQNSPRTPIVYALSYYFDVSIPWLMGFDVPKGSSSKMIALPSDEETLLEVYRSLPKPGKEYIHQQLHAAKALFGEKSEPVPAQDAQ